MLRRVRLSPTGIGDASEAPHRAITLPTRSAEPRAQRERTLPIGRRLPARRRPLQPKGCLWRVGTGAWWLRCGWRVRRSRRLRPLTNDLGDSAGKLLPVGELGHTQLLQAGKKGRTPMLRCISIARPEFFYKFDHSQQTGSGRGSGRTHMAHSSSAHKNHRSIIASHSGVAKTRHVGFMLSPCTQLTGTAPVYSKRWSVTVEIGSRESPASISYLA